MGTQLKIGRLFKKKPLDHLIEPAVRGGSPSPDQAARPTTASAVQQELVNPGESSEDQRQVSTSNRRITAPEGAARRETLGIGSERLERGSSKGVGLGKRDRLLCFVSI